MKPEKERQRFAIDSKSHNVISCIYMRFGTKYQENIETSNEVFHI